MVIQSIDGKYKKEFKSRPCSGLSVAKLAFTQDDRRAVFMLSGDTLAILTLGTSSIKFIENVKSFEVQKKATEDGWHMLKLRKK
ncbi:hypothetical protein [Pedobacter steynii]